MSSVVGHLICYLYLGRAFLELVWLKFSRTSTIPPGYEFSVAVMLTARLLNCCTCVGLWRDVNTNNVD